METCELRAKNSELNDIINRLQAEHSEVISDGSNTHSVVIISDGTNTHLAVIISDVSNTHSVVIISDVSNTRLTLTNMI